MLKKIFISAVLLLAVLSFVVSMLKGNNNGEKTVSVPDRVAGINISGTIMSGTDSNDNLFNQTSGVGTPPYRGSFFVILFYVELGSPARGAVIEQSEMTEGYYLTYDALLPRQQTP